MIQRHCRSSVSPHGSSWRRRVEIPTPSALQCYRHRKLMKTAESSEMPSIIIHNHPFIIHLSSIYHPFIIHISSIIHTIIHIQRIYSPMDLPDFGDHPQWFNLCQKMTHPPWRKMHGVEGRATSMALKHRGRIGRGTKKTPFLMAVFGFTLIVTKRYSRA